MPAITRCHVGNTFTRTYDGSVRPVRTAEAYDYSVSAQTLYSIGCRQSLQAGSNNWYWLICGIRCASSTANYISIGNSHCAIRWGGCTLGSQTINLGKETWAIISQQIHTLIQGRSVIVCCLRVWKKWMGPVCLLTLCADFYWLRYCAHSCYFLASPSSQAWSLVGSNN